MSTLTCALAHVQLGVCGVLPVKMCLPLPQVPAFDYWTGCAHGVAELRPWLGATIFPMPLGLAATFDSKLVLEVGARAASFRRAQHGTDQKPRLFLFLSHFKSGESGLSQAFLKLAVLTCRPSSHALSACHVSHTKAATCSAMPCKARPPILHGIPGWI